MKPALLLTLAFASSALASAPDWPQWRGPKSDGISPEKGLLKEWPSDGPPLAWRTKGVGNGMSSISIAGGRIYTLGKRNRDGVNGVFVTALKLADGSELWATAITTGNAPQPNGTPTVDGKLLYAIGNNGDLACLETDTGKLVWKKSFPADFGGKCMSGWGYSESPLVDGDRLIVVPGAPDAGMAALNKKTGEVIWKSEQPDFGRAGKDGAGYTGVVISQAAGIKQYVKLTGREIGRAHV